MFANTAPGGIDTETVHEAQRYAVPGTRRLEQRNYDFRPMRRCAHCGQWFRTWRATVQRYCGGRCKQAAYRKRKALETHPCSNRG